MTPVPNLATYKNTFAQDEQGASSSNRKMEKRRRTVGSPGLARLMHLWESKGRTSYDFKVSCCQSTSSPMSGHSVPQQPLSNDRGDLRLPSRGKAEIRTHVPRRLPLQQHVLAFRSINRQPELITPDRVLLLQDDAMSSRSIPSSVLQGRPSSNHSDHRQRAGTTDQDSDTTTSITRSLHSSDDYTKSTVQHVASSSVSQEQPGSRWEIKNSDTHASPRSPIDRFDRHSEVEMSSNRTLNIGVDRHGIGNKEQRKQAEECGEAGGMMNVKPGQSLSSLSLETGHSWNNQTRSADHEPQNADADQHWRSDDRFATLATRPSPSSSRKYKHLRCGCRPSSEISTREAMRSHKDFLGKASVPKVASSVVSEPPTSQVTGLRSSRRGKSQSAEKNRQPRQASLVRISSTEEHLTSSEYYSLGSTGVESRQASPYGDPKTTEQGMKEPTMIDAATQTEMMAHEWNETTSQWSEDASGARHKRQGVFHRVPTAIRFERKPRRPTMRKVQVIVSLDGATDLAMNARLVPKLLKG
ncbi:MAG: hypothetical protein Q9202_006033 [Teloschistes flavicans]